MDIGLKHWNSSQYECQLSALSEWSHQRFEGPGRRNGSARLRKLHSKESAVLRSKAFVLGCLGHLRVLSSLIDGALAKAIVYSFFENRCSDASSPLSIFRFVHSTFGLLRDVKAEPASFGRGKVLLRLLRCLHQHRGCSLTLTLIFVCACRCYGISARLVAGVFGPASTVSIFAESFDRDSGSWKRADFSRFSFDNVDHTPLKSARHVVPERAASYQCASSCDYRGYLYVSRHNKVFVYKRGSELRVVAIVVFRGNPVGQALLNVSEFPFEESEFRQRLVQDRQKESPRSLLRDYSYVFGCNRLCWFSELTAKYVDRYNDVCLKRGRSLHEWLVQLLFRLNSHLQASPACISVSLLERAELKWLECRVSNDPLPDCKSKFKNHPVYVLASQIGGNRVKKAGATPIAFLKGEEVFVRGDFEDLKSRSAWLKVNRRVRDDERPVSTRRSYNRTTRTHGTTCLYSESQTDLLSADKMHDGRIPTTEYDNVDATGQRFIPNGTVYLRSKNPALLFEAARSLKLHHKRAFSSYQAVDTFKPEIDGLVVRKSDVSKLLAKYEELAVAASAKAFESKKDSYRTFWRSVFKTMLSDPPSVAHEHHRKIRKELSAHVSRFLNRLEHLT